MDEEQVKNAFKVWTKWKEWRKRWQGYSKHQYTRGWGGPDMNLSFASKLT